MAARTRTLLAWALWLATLACCAGGLLAALLWIRPLTPGLLATGVGAALAFPLGNATVGLVLGLRRPANPIGWLFGASGLVWALTIPFEPWLNTLLLDHRPLALAGQVAVVCSGRPAGRRPSRSAPPCRSCCCRTGGCGHAAGGWWWPTRWSGWSCWWSGAPWPRDR